jgi:(S)-2-hydroxy-acid oxidase
MSWPNILSNGSDTSNRTDYDPSLDWESTIPWLRKHTTLKIWLKGSMFFHYCIVQHQ